MKAHYINPFELILYPYQLDILNCSSKYQILNQSRQSGKSLTCSAKAVKHSITHPNALTLIISTGDRASRELLKKCINWSESVKVATNGMMDYESNNAEIRFSNGARIKTLPSGNPAALRGYSGSVIIDEFAIMKNQDEVWASIMPVITSTKDSWMLIASTPTALTNRYAKIWFDESRKWKKWKITLEDAVKQGLQANIDELKEIVNDDEIWRVEYCCEFASSSDNPFNMEIITSDSNEFDIQKGYPSNSISLGGDIARTGDLTVFSVVKSCVINSVKKYFLLDMLSLKDTPFKQQLEALKGLWHKWNCSTGLIDSTGIGKMFAEEASRTISTRIKPFNFTQSSKLDLFENARKVINNREFICNPRFVEEVALDFGQLRRQVNNNGSISYFAQHSKSGHADRATSIALALMCGSKNKEIFIPEFSGRSTVF